MLNYKPLFIVIFLLSLSSADPSDFSSSSNSSATDQLVLIKKYPDILKNRIQSVENNINQVLEAIRSNDTLNIKSTGALTPNGLKYFPKIMRRTSLRLCKECYEFDIPEKIFQNYIVIENIVVLTVTEKKYELNLHVLTSSGQIDKVFLVEPKVILKKVPASKMRIQIQVNSELTATPIDSIDYEMIEAYITSHYRNSKLIELVPENSSLSENSFELNCNLYIFPQESIEDESTMNMKLILQRTNNEKILTQVYKENLKKFLPDKIDLALAEIDRKIGQERTAMKKIWAFLISEPGIRVVYVMIWGGLQLYTELNLKYRKKLPDVPPFSR